MNDEFMLGLVAWRENRAGGTAGLQSVMNVIMNRVYQHKTSPYSEIVKPWQFSSITAKGDLQLGLWPGPMDPQWIQAQQMAAQAASHALQDITGGATFYFALTIKKPAWADAMLLTTIIAGQAFYKEA